MPSCVYCKLLKAFLKKNSVIFKEHVVEDKEAFFEKHKVKTLPQIFDYGLIIKNKELVGQGNYDHKNDSTLEPGHTSTEEFAKITEIGSKEYVSMLLKRGLSPIKNYDKRAEDKKKRGLNFDISQFSIELFKFFRKKDKNIWCGISNKKGKKKIFYRKKINMLNTLNKDMAKIHFKNRS